MPIPLPHSPQGQVKMILTLNTVSPVSEQFRPTNFKASSRLKSRLKSGTVSLRVKEGEFRGDTESRVTSPPLIWFSGESNCSPGRKTEDGLKMVK